MNLFEENWIIHYKEQFNENDVDSWQIQVKIID